MRFMSLLFVATFLGACVQAPQDPQTFAGRLPAAAGDDLDLVFAGGSAFMSLGDREQVGELDLVSETGHDRRSLSLAVIAADYSLIMTQLVLDNAEDHIDPGASSLICSGTINAQGQASYDRDETAVITRLEILDVDDYGVSYAFETGSRSGEAIGVAHFDFE